MRTTQQTSLIVAEVCKEIIERGKTPEIITEVCQANEINERHIRKVLDIRPDRLIHKEV